MLSGVSARRARPHYSRSRPAVRPTGSAMAVLRGGAMVLTGETILTRMRSPDLRMDEQKKTSADYQRAFRERMRAAGIRPERAAVAARSA